MRNARKIYRVLSKGDGGKYIRMPKDAEGHYIRKIGDDGSVVFVPLNLDEHDEPVKKKKKAVEEPAVTE